MISFSSAWSSTWWIRGAVVTQYDGGLLSPPTTVILGLICAEWVYNSANLRYCRCFWIIHSGHGCVATAPLKTLRKLHCRVKNLLEPQQHVFKKIYTYMYVYELNENYFQGHTRQWPHMLPTCPASAAIAGVATSTATCFTIQVLGIPNPLTKPPSWTLALSWRSIFHFHIPDTAITDCSYKILVQ